MSIVSVHRPAPLPRVQNAGERRAAGHFGGGARPAIALGLLVAGVATAALALRHQRIPSVRPLQTEVVVRGAVVGVLRVTGRLESSSTVRVGTVLPGQVTAVGARVGDQVVRGQMLARIDDLEQRASLAAAQASLDAARLDEVAAEKRLFELLGSAADEGDMPEELEPDELLRGAAGEAQLDLMKAVVQVTRRQRARALAHDLLGRSWVRAPISGVVLARAIERGETVVASPPGPPLFVIGADPEQLRLSAEVDEIYAGRVHPGPAGFTVPARPQRSFSATVRAVAAAPAVQAGPARYQVVLDVGNADRGLEPGMTAIVDLPMTSSPGALLAPSAAIDRSGDAAAPAVWTLAPGGGQAVRVPVELGVSDGRFVEVRGAGIAAGTALVITASP